MKDWAREYSQMTDREVRKRADAKDDKLVPAEELPVLEAELKKRCLVKTKRTDSCLSCKNSAAGQDYDYVYEAMRISQTPFGMDRTIESITLGSRTTFLCDACARQYLASKERVWFSGCIGYLAMAGVIGLYLAWPVITGSGKIGEGNVGIGGVILLLAFFALGGWLFLGRDSDWSRYEQLCEHVFSLEKPELSHIHTLPPGFSISRRS